MEVELLRPGTVILHATTVLHDIKHLYVKLSKMLREYFKVCQVSVSVEYIILYLFGHQKRDHAVHFAIDGWTAPLVASYLGIVVIWYEHGKIHRAKFTGQYWNLPSKSQYLLYI
jgi:hypothetical protein